MTTTEPARTAADCPRVPIPAADTLLVELAAPHPNGLAPMVGQRSDVPGLLLMPYAAGTPLRYTGDWCLTHAATGARVSLPAGHLHTREALHWLAGRGVDWTQTAPAILDDPAAKDAHTALFYQLWDARQEHRPLLYARTSWREWPPRYRIRHRSMISVEAFDTFEAAAELADDATTMPDGALHLHPDAEIYREPRGPGWGLRCASIACGDSSWLVDWAADEWHALGTRTDIAELAREEGWAWHRGDYWTCPECTRLYH
ncbi:hypothetical protein AB0L41_42830 [Amycolatopsis mediterranei]|uniref:hypothetical protein n=1 Tax=Amycolatopsis mediterranei TaxID=33910 RepID=UPI003437B8A6